MPAADALITFATLSFAIIIVPGPSVTFIIGRALALGRGAALLTVLGNAGGLLVQVVVVAAGLGPLVAQSDALSLTVRLVGAAYLVWLGLQAIRHRHEHVEAAGSAGAERTSAILREGFVVGVSNPKTIALFTALLPQFLNPDGAAAAVQLVLLGGIFIGIALVADSAWAVAAGTARKALTKDARLHEWLGMIGGTVMVVLGLLLAVAG